MPQKLKIDWRVFPPYIDAYKINSENEDNSFNRFSEAMKQYALEWAYESIGRQFVSGEVRWCRDGYIVCCGKFGDMQYLAYMKKKKEDGYTLDFESITIKEGAIPPGVDVT
jgi:hypothetical protein